MSKQFFRVSNISGQRLMLEITTSDGQKVTDYLEEGEMVYGLNDNAVQQLDMCERLSLIKIEETDERENPKVRWLFEGF